MLYSGTIKPLKCLALTVVVVFNAERVIFSSLEYSVSHSTQAAPCTHAGRNTMPVGTIFLHRIGVFLVCNSKVEQLGEDIVGAGVVYSFFLGSSWQYFLPIILVVVLLC